MSILAVHALAVNVVNKLVMAFWSLKPALRAALGMLGMTRRSSPSAVRALVLTFKGVKGVMWPTRPLSCSRKQNNHF